MIALKLNTIASRSPGLRAHGAAALAIVGMFSLTSAASAQGNCVESVLLAGWSAESYANPASGQQDGVWVLDGNQTGATQDLISNPTVLISDFTVSSAEFEGRFRVDGSGDDFLGFTIGFEPGDATNPGADYLLIDWKRNVGLYPYPGCLPGVAAARGLALSRVTGTPAAEELWCHAEISSCTGPGSTVEELQRGLSRGDVGWLPATSYLIRIRLTPRFLMVWVNNQLEFFLAGDYVNSRVGFYAFSQADVTFSDYERRSVGTQTPYGQGWPGLNGVPELFLSAAPTLDAAGDIVMGNASDVPRPGCIVISQTQANTLLPTGARLLVGPAMRTFDELLDVGLTTLPFGIPDSSSACGVTLFVQGYHTDPAAVGGFAATRGLRIDVGL